MRAGTPEAENFNTELGELEAKVLTLKPETVAHLAVIWRDEHENIRHDIDTARSRGAQLLAVTGFLTVLVAITSGLPPSGTAHTVAVVAVGLLAFFFVGTVWLTYHVIKVAAWEQLLINPPEAHEEGELEEAQREYAQELLKASTRLRLRFRVPTGYLRDAYLYFAFTTVLVLVLVLVKFFAGGANSTVAGSQPSGISSPAPSQSANASNR